MKPIIKRSKIRVLFGKFYYTIKQLFYWYCSKTNFAQTINKEKLSTQIFVHKSKLLRELKGVDMWMQYNKIKNLKIAIQKLNGLIIKPGEVFSYWRQIGKVTKKKGYVNGMILKNGKVVAGLGGGLCQLSNLIYWMTLHTSLIVVERWRHGYDVFPDVNRKQPFGSGATCAYPNIDLQIKNNTEQKFQLFFKLTETHLIGQYLSDKPCEFKYKIFEKKHEIKQEWYGDYIRSNIIFREILNADTEEKIDEEFVTANYARMMYNPLLEYKDHKKYKIN